MLVRHPCFVLHEILFYNIVGLGEIMIILSHYLNILDDMISYWLFNTTI
jgi:hypothetical protein